MATVAQKVRTITLANVHSFLDWVGNWNDVGQLEQYARDLQKAHDMLDDQAASYKSDATVLPTEIAGLEARHVAADANISVLLSDSDPTNDHKAAVLEAQLMTLEDQIRVKRNKLESARTEAAKFADAVSKIDLKLASVNGQIAVLRDTQSATTAKEKSAKLLEGVSISDMPNVDNVAERLRRKSAVADNRLNRAMGRVTDAVSDSTLDATVAARLAARRQKVDAAKT